MTDVVADPDMDAATRAHLEAWTGCVAGAPTRGEIERGRAAAGFVDVAVEETHRVHERAGSAVIRARAPAG